MSVVLTLTRKNLLDSRWLLAIISSSLFGLCWLFVFSTHRTEAILRQMELDPLFQGGRRTMGFFRGLGGASMDFSSASIQIAYWKLPFIPLIVAIWAISRGSLSVAGEIEKGSLDLVMSRPVSRTSFLSSQVLTALIGFALMAIAMTTGSLLSSRYNSLNSPPSILVLSKPTLNLIALGFAIFGYTFLLSTTDIIRWRPTLIASVATLAGFIAQAVGSIPSLELEWLKSFSIFEAYDPVEVVTKGETLAFNTSILGGIGAATMILGFVIFSRRDLPAGS